jgi:Glycosyltransferase family 87
MTDSANARGVSWRGVWIALAVALVAALVATWLNARADEELLPYEKGEAHVYNLAAERILGGEEIFRPQDGKPFTYPPFMAVLFAPIAILPHYAVRPVWYACNFLMLAWVVVLLAGLFPRPFSGVGRARLFWVPTVVLAGRHVVSPLENQSNDLFVMLFVMLGVRALCRSREKTAGLVLGLGAATKATPMLFLPMLLWQRRFVAAIAVPLGAIVAQLAMEMVFPRQDGELWIMVWYRTFVSGIDAIGGNAENVGNAWAAWNVRNQNLGSLIYRLSTPISDTAIHTFDVSLWRLDGAPLRYVMFASQLMVLGVIAWALRPRRGNHGDEDDANGESDGERVYRRLGEGGAVACGMVLLSPMSSKSHFCVLLLPIAFCCYHYFHVRRSRVVLGCLLVLLGGALTSHSVVGTRMGYQILARGSVTWCTLAALLGTVVVLGELRVPPGGTAVGAG